MADEELEALHAEQRRLEQLEAQRKAAEAREQTRILRQLEQDRKNNKEK